MTRGRRTGRTAYVLREWDLPAPLPGAEWAPDSKFNAAEELVKDPKLKATLAAVLKNGAELAGTVGLKMRQKPSPSLSADTPVKDVDLPARVQKALELNGITTVRQLREMPDATLLSLQYLGPRSVAYLRAQLGSQPRNTEASQPQLPRFRPDGQPPERPS